MRGHSRFVIWALILLGMFILFSQAGAPETVVVSYSQFRDDVSRVTDFRLLSDERTFQYTVSDQEVILQSVMPPGMSRDVINELLARGISVSADPPAQGSVMLSFLLAFLPVVLLVGVMIWLYRRTTSGGGGLASIGKSPAQLVDPTMNTTRLTDVAGNPGDFDDVHEIIDYLKSPQKYFDANAKLPHGILMYGPPGTGKTLLARAIAGEAKVPFFTISGSDFIEMFVGVGASRVRDMFRELRMAQPAILFIDEIDAVGAKRGDGILSGGHREADQTLNQLLTEMDGFDTSGDAVMVIAATNRPELLDPALLRPGRFDRKIALSLPDINARAQILSVHMKGHTADSNVDLNKIARGTPGMSGADLANLINEAAMIVGKASRKAITMADLDAARDKILMGRAKSLVMDDDEKRMTAYHEAGHAIAAYFEPEHDPLYKVTIIPRDMALGVTMYLPEKDKYSINKKKLLANIVSLMGGRAAEEIQYGEECISTGASNDLEVASGLARKMITRWGFGKTTGLSTYSLAGNETFAFADATKEAIDKEVRDMLSSAYEKAKFYLTTNKAALDKVAATLMERESIDDVEFKAIMEEYKAVM